MRAPFAVADDLYGDMASGLVVLTLDHLPERPAAQRVHHLVAVRDLVVRHLHSHGTRPLVSVVTTQVHACVLCINKKCADM